jgi:hypothetical protein
MSDINVSLAEQNINVSLGTDVFNAGVMETGPKGDTGVGYFEIHEIAQEDLDNKYITIEGEITDNQNILVFIDNVGIKAELSVDYSVSGNEVFWNGYELENTLVVGDKIKVFYM